MSLGFNVFRAIMGEAKRLPVSRQRTPRAWPIPKPLSLTEGRASHDATDHLPRHLQSAGPMMGAQLTSRVFAYWTHLPDRPFRLLVHMSHLVKDTNEVPTYWGGRDAMAQALGLEVGTNSTHTMVKRAIKRLIDEGAIRRTFDGHAGSRSEYRLTLERGNSKVPLRGNSSDTQRGNARDPHRGYSGDPAGVTPASPQGTTIGTTEEPGEEDKSRSLEKSPSARVEKRKASDARLTLIRERADQERGA